MSKVYHSIQGNIGLGKAIEYFVSHGITVSIPLNDTQKYDLIADFDGKLNRISVKTSRFSPKYNKNVFCVLLKNCGGSSGKNKCRKFDNTLCDYVFIYTANNDIYLIPSDVITAKNGITVGIKYTEYIVKSKNMSEFKDDIEQNKKISAE